ncbi:AAA family ATPase, partial [bacterium]|nr:AAA family ATPase [bacterium]
QDAKGGEELVDRADKALYYSKRTGKNRVTSASLVEGQIEVADLDALAGFPSRAVVGRESAFNALGDSVDIVSQGRNAFVLVEGPPGIGKTRFLSELVRYSKERDLVCLLEKCTPVGREDAYKAISGLLERYFRAEPHALNVVARALDTEKRLALGEIVPAVREHETAFAAANAAAAIKALEKSPQGPATGKERVTSKRSTAAALEALTRLAKPVSPGQAPRPEDGQAKAPSPGPHPTPAPKPSGVFPRPNPKLGPVPSTGAPPAPSPPPSSPTPPPGHPIAPLGPGSGQYTVGTKATGRPAAPTPPSTPKGPPLSPPTPLPGPPPPPPTPGSGMTRPAPMRKTGPQPPQPPGRKSGEVAIAPEPGSPVAQALGTDSQDAAQAGEVAGGHSITVFTAVCETLVALSVVRPLLIMFDDIDHADEATLEVIARTLPREGRVLFCGGSRPDAWKDEEAPYGAFHESLSQHANVSTIELEALDKEQTAELATHLLQGFRPPAPLLEKIHALSRGNPLFIEGVLKYLIATAVLVRHEGGWQLQKEIPETIPVTLEDLVRGQLAVLDKETADAIADAAVIGPNFDFQVLRNIGGKQRSEGEALDLVEAARRARIVRDTEGGEFEFTSSVVADVTYKGLSEERKQTTHRRVAELVEKREGGAASAASLAFHYRRAGDKEKAERFEAALRARCESIFDRDAIEQLDDVKPPRIPEVVTPPVAALWPLVQPLAKAICHAARTAKPAPDGAKQPDERDEEAALSALQKCFE